MGRSSVRHAPVMRYTREMDSLFFHPRIVHIPIALGALMPLIVLGLAIAWWKKWLPPQSIAIALGLQIVLAVSSMMAMRSGEEAEHVAKRVVSKKLIHDHEEAGEAFLFSAFGGVLLLGAAFALRNKKAGLPLAAGAAALSTVSAVLCVRVGAAGGELVYKHGAAAAYAPVPSTSTTGTAPTPTAPVEHDED